MLSWSWFWSWSQAKTGFMISFLITGFPCWFFMIFHSLYKMLPWEKMSKNSELLFLFQASLLSIQFGLGKLTIFNISKSVHERQPHKTLRGRICHQHIQKCVQHDLLLDTNTHMHALNKCKALKTLKKGKEKTNSIFSSYLLREARPHWVLRVAEWWALEHGCGEFQHLPKELIKLCKHHDATGVGDLRENIWESKCHILLLSKNRMQTSTWHLCEWKLLILGTQTQH